MTSSVPGRTDRPDPAGGQPAWAAVKTGLFGHKHTFVPIRDAQVADDDQVRVPLDKEQASHKKDNDARDARVGMLSAKLTSLGQDVSRLETERTGLGGELETAKKRMEELKKAQAQAEARAAQFRKLVTQFKTLTDAANYVDLSYLEKAAAKR